MGSSTSKGLREVVGRGSLAWAFAGLVGCGGAASPGTATGASDGEPGGAASSSAELPYFKSGQRLRAWGHVVGDARQFLYFEDSALGERCEFVASADGKGALCVPSNSARLIYLDEDCKQPATFLYPNRHTTAVSIPSEGTYTCAGSLAPYRPSYRVGELVYEEMVASRTPLFSFENGQCQPGAHDGKSDPPVYRLTRISDDELVAGRSVERAVSNELAVLRVVADDSAELTVGVRSADHRPCAVQESGECAPLPFAIEAGPFLNADCTQPTLVSPNDRACGAARYARQQTPNGVRIYELAPAPARFRQELRDPLPDPPIDIFRCTAVQSAGEGFVLGKDVTGSFPKTSTISVGSGAAHVELSRIGTSTASASRPSALLPRQEPDEFVLGDGRHCRVREATDGTLRCAVLEGNAYQNGFVDPECKVRLYELSSEVLEDAVAHPSWLGVSDYDSRGKLTGSYSLERYTGDTYEFSSGTCLPADSSSSNRWVANQRTDFTEMPLVELRQL